MGLSDVVNTHGIISHPYTVCRGPVNLLESTPPKVISPFASEGDAMGPRKMPTCFAEIAPWVKRLSRTVGNVRPLDVVPVSRDGDYSQRSSGRDG